MVLEFEQIEQSKENVQPIASGRDAAQLAARLEGMNKKPVENTTNIFSAACAEWEDKLAADKGSDPLALWDDYIKWAQQNATSDKMQAMIVPLLQRATREFQDESRYKNDPRYLRMWIRYVDTVQDPADIFAFLDARKIGDGLALFYTSWALILELKKGDYSAAYTKLEEGINRKAHPVEKIVKTLEQFQHRPRRPSRPAPHPGQRTRGRRLRDLRRRGRGRVRRRVGRVRHGVAPERDREDQGEHARRLAVDQGGGRADPAAPRPPGGRGRRRREGRARRRGLRAVPGPRAGRGRGAQARGPRRRAPAGGRAHGARPRPGGSRPPAGPTRVPRPGAPRVSGPGAGQACGGG
ncbi:Mad3/BUB1 homology region 1-domain-containing protein [Baffinella frigidus]|nr:Mad3/BUB1 homology region 1-domain-containing protein [Cryptophyta sp. CCMP2293]